MFHETGSSSSVELSDKKKTTMWFWYRLDTNQAVQAQKMARGWEFGV